MTTRAFSSLVNKITPYAPGCPEPVVIQAVRDSAIEMCENTLVWRFEQETFPLTPGVYSYEYEVPDDSEVVGIFQAVVNGVKLTPTTLEQLVGRYASWPDTTVANRSSPQLIAQFDPDNFVVAPVPDGDTRYLLKMFLALRPTPDATGMDEVIFDQCEQLITHSTLVRLLSMPEKSWTNNDLADYHARLASYKTASRRANANLGNGRASLTVRSVSFGV